MGANIFIGSANDLKDCKKSGESVKKLNGQVFSALIIMKKAVIVLCIYCLSDLGVSSNLNGLVRYLGVTEHFSLAKELMK